MNIVFFLACPSLPLALFPRPCSLLHILLPVATAKYHTAGSGYPLIFGLYLPVVLSGSCGGLLCSPPRYHTTFRQLLRLIPLLSLTQHTKPLTLPVHPKPNSKTKPPTNPTHIQEQEQNNSQPAVKSNPQPTTNPKK